MKHNQISLPTAVLMIINIMVGTGILIGPGKMAQVAGNASFLSWPLVALLFLPLVLCTIQLAAMFPGPGGFYAYAHNGLNRTAGFLSGWLYLVGYTFAATIELLALRETLLVWMGSDHWFLANPLLFNPAIVAICTGLNLLSIRFFSRLINSLTISKLLPLITLIVLIPFIINTSFTVSAQELKLLPFSFPLTIFGYFGFEYCCSMTHLIVDSERNGPKAILLGFSIVALIYTLFNFGLLNLMGAENLATLGAPAFAQFITLPIPFVTTLLALLIPLASAITLFAGANGMINGNSLLLHTMAEEKLFKFGSYLTPLSRFHRPWRAVMVQAIAILLLMTLIPSIPVIGGLCNVGILLSFVLPFVSLLNIQTKKKQPYKALFTMFALCILFGLIMYSVYCIADTVRARLLYAIPFAIALFVGVFLLEGQQKK